MRRVVRKLAARSDRFLLRVCTGGRCPQSEAAALACRADRERRHHQRGVGPGIANMRAHVHDDVARGDTLAGHFVSGLVGEASAGGRERGERIFSQALLDRLLARRADIGKAHAVSRQQRRERMDQHLGHAQRVGNQTGVLAAGAAEAVERIARHVVPALHRDFLDRVRHVLHRDLDEAVGDVLGGAAVSRSPGQARRRRHARRRHRWADSARARRSSGRNRQ